MVKFEARLKERRLEVIITRKELGYVYMEAGLCSK